MNIKIALVPRLFALTAALLAPGCAATSEDLATPTDQPYDDSAEASAPAVESVGSNLNSSGQYCGGYCIAPSLYLPSTGQTCYGGNFLLYTYLPNVTQDCRARIVDYCHNRNFRFGDAYWSNGRPYAGWLCSTRI